ncbi:amidohydrolase family protein [Hoeflea marina]|uniref:amidohydrolase family protein n=1 Tax=Hoeflea marina TaxID=274592 RepID=UPI001AECE941|nr:amidohydrolase family protein [Hoeflea marina]
MKIDAHQHFWNPARGDYGWMPEDDPVLSQVYRPADLEPVLRKLGIDGTVLVQAAPTVDETEYMLGIADTTPFVAGVVGWVDFERATDRAELERLSLNPKFLGVRPMIQDIEDLGWMLRPDVQWGFETLVDLGLSLDALGYPRHMANFLALIRRYPELRVVVDHGMKPEIGNHSEDSFASWADGMARIAGESGAFCKLSGMITEAGADWTVDDLRPYADHILDVFGPRRVMWGSDWPVCRLRADYEDWHAAARQLTSGLGEDAQELIFGGTAAAFYRLEP